MFKRSDLTIILMHLTNEVQIMFSSSSSSSSSSSRELSSSPNTYLSQAKEYMKYKHLREQNEIRAQAFFVKLDSEAPIMIDEKIKLGTAYEIGRKIFSRIKFSPCERELATLLSQDLSQLTQDQYEKLMTLHQSAASFSYADFLSTSQGQDNYLSRDYLKDAAQHLRLALLAYENITHVNSEHKKTKMEMLSLLKKIYEKLQLDSRKNGSVFKEYQNRVSKIDEEMASLLAVSTLPPLQAIAPSPSPSVLSSPPSSSSAQTTETSIVLSIQSESGVHPLFKPAPTTRTTFLPSLGAALHSVFFGNIAPKKENPIEIPAHKNYSPP